MDQVVDDLTAHITADEKIRLVSWLQRNPFDERPWNLPTAMPVDVDTFDGRVRRLIERVQSEHGLRLMICPRRVHDEKCRYVLLEKEVGSWIQRDSRIDKHTEAILPIDNGPPRGLLTDPNPARFFGPRGLLYVSDLQRIDPTYTVARRRELTALLADATQQSQSMSSRDRKRLHASVWDESGVRRRRVLTTKIRPPQEASPTVVKDLGSDNEDEDDDDDPQPK